MIRQKLADLLRYQIGILNEKGNMTTSYPWQKFLSDLQSRVPPYLKEFWKIVTGNDPLGTYQLTVLREGAELELSGPITFGATDAVKALFKTHPDIKILHLNSAGGRIAEARRLAAFIEARGLITYTATGCASASVLPFAAGRERLIGPDAALGFHQYTFPGMDQEDFEVEYDKDKKFLAARGIAPEFIDKIFEAPSDQFWTPSHEELFAAGYVTRYPQENEVALSGAGPMDAASVEQEFLKIPLYAAVKECDPATYDQLTRAVRKAVKKGQSLDEMRSATLPLIQKVQASRLARASDTALLQFTKLLVEQMGILNKVDPLLGYGFAYGTHPPGTDLSHYFSDQINERELEVGAEIIRSFDTTRPIPSEAEVQWEMERLFTGLAGTYSDKAALITQNTHKEQDREDVALVLCAMYSRILKLPPKRAVPVLRHVFG